MINRVIEGKELSSWIEEKKMFLEYRGKDLKEMVDRRRRVEAVYDGWEQRDRELQKEER